MSGVMAGKMDRPEHVSLPHDGPYTRAFREARMSSQSTRAQAQRQQRRHQLRELVERLGRHATPSEIREEAYRVGFGQVSTHMLVAVRNQLWPDRPKHGGGTPKGGRRATTVNAPGELLALISCPACGSPMTRSMGGRTRRDGSRYQRRRCQECNGTFTAPPGLLGNGKQVHPRRLLSMTATEKECSKCKRVLPVANFGRKANDPQIFRASCKQCLNEYRYKHQFREATAAFGITVAGYQELLSRQGGGCAICGVRDPGSKGSSLRNRRRFALDHCHTTGVLRGLLCNRCNIGLGNFNDDASRLEAAAAYLRSRSGGCMLNGEEVTYA